MLAVALFPYGSTSTVALVLVLVKKIPVAGSLQRTSQHGVVVRAQASWRMQIVLSPLWMWQIAGTLGTKIWRWNNGDQSATCSFVTGEVMINHGTFEVTETSKFVDGSTWKDSTRGDNWLVTSPSKDFSSLAMKQKADFKVNACHILLQIQLR